MAQNPAYQPLYTAFREFYQRCLVEDCSLLWPERRIWTPENVAAVKQAFVDNPQMGKEKSFKEKLEFQMQGLDRECWGIIADIAYVYFLPSVSMKPGTKIDFVGWAAANGGLEVPDQADSIWIPFENGFSATGIKYHYKYTQFALLLELAQVVKASENRESLLQDREEMQQTLDRLLEKVPKNERAYDMRHAILYLAFPEYYVRSISTGDKQAIIQHFQGYASEPLPDDLDQALYEIHQEVSKTLHEDNFDFYGEGILETWKPGPGIKDLENDLAEPFSKIFSDLEEADWAFDLIAETLNRVGITDHDDPRWAITLNKRYGGTNLHVNIRNWLFLGFRSINNEQSRVRISFLKDRITLDDEYLEHKFKGGAGEPEVFSYGLPIMMVKPLEGELRAAYEDTLEVLRMRVEANVPSNYRRKHVPEIGEAVFDPGKRVELLAHGLKQSLDDISEDNPTSDEYENDQVELKSPYTLKDFSEDTFYDLELAQRWARAIQRKKQAIFYGPPGTGKTFVAEHMARHLVSRGDGFVELVQFHPSYAYEDFMQGIRPQSRPGGGLEYPLVPGRFMRFCQAASELQGTCVLIVDEINRANLARVFGELMYLLEYRDREIPLAGGGRFHIPENVRLIGTMNTADRSIALVDHALRRRFAFLPLYPNYDVLSKYHQSMATGFPVEGLINQLKVLNHQIGDPHYEIGISFFMRENLASEIEDIWQMEIEPYLEEYFFDQPEKVDLYRWKQVVKYIES